MKKIFVLAFVLMVIGLSVVPAQDMAQFEREAAQLAADLQSGKIDMATFNRKLQELTERAATAAGAPSGSVPQLQQQGQQADRLLQQNQQTQQYRQLFDGKDGVESRASGNPQQGWPSANNFWNHGFTLNPPTINTPYGITTYYTLRDIETDRGNVRIINEVFIHRNWEYSMNSRGQEPFTAQELQTIRNGLESSIGSKFDNNGSIVKIYGEWIINVDLIQDGEWIELSFRLRARVG
jgi:hypothetical protein